MHYYDERTDILLDDSKNSKAVVSAQTSEMKAWIRSNIPTADYGHYIVWVGTTNKKIPLTEYIEG